MSSSSPETIRPSQYEKSLERSLEWAQPHLATRDGWQTYRSGDSVPRPATSGTEHPDTSPAYQQSPDEPMSCKIPTPVSEVGGSSTSGSRKLYHRPAEEADTRSPEDKAVADADMRRYFIPNSDIESASDPDRRALLSAALKLAKQVPVIEPTTFHGGSVSRLEQYNSSMYPSADFLSLLFNSPPASDAETYHWEMSSNHSLGKVKEMAFAILNGTVHGSDRLLYILSVNCVAYTFLTAMDVNEQDDINVELNLAAQAKYLKNIECALQHLDTQPRQDPLLFQALLSAAMAMQDAGYMRRCWRLNWAACGVGALLDEAWFRQSTLPAEELVQIRIALMKCYIHDRALSIDFSQPSSLMDLPLDTKLLDLEKPCDAMLLTMVDIAKVTDALFREARAYSTAGNGQINKAMVQDQVKLLQEIMARSDEFRNRPPSSTDPYLISEWASIDFVYFSMMASLVRLSAGDSRSTDQEGFRYDQEGVRYARKALSSLLQLLKCATVSSSYRMKALASVCWVVPLFTLRPVFVLFRSMVIFSDALDLKLMQDVSERLDLLASSRHCLAALHQLCKSLVDMYAKFAEKAIYQRHRQDSTNGKLIQRRAASPVATFQQPPLHAQPHGFGNFEDMFSGRLLDGPSHGLGLDFLDSFDWPGMEIVDGL
ncbi:hypothetical protein N7541_002713 [Penicillium brevicompactum]|uniref:Transcription factor domain-containing protein n=1 Tax=Penicillium brevicompactum TaxID=5074 RepID=A0A9W9UZ40_PENBR|nr:hypothetical protein N7541_002713 [Penicillium brevicompactum]